MLEALLLSLSFLHNSMNKQANEIEDIYGFFSSGSISINKERRGTLRAFHPQDQTNPLIPVLEGIFVKSRTFRAHNTKNFMVYVCPLRQRGENNNSGEKTIGNNGTETHAIPVLTPYLLVSAGLRVNVRKPPLLFLLEEVPSCHVFQVMRDDMYVCNETTKNVLYGCMVRSQERAIFIS